MGVVEVYRREGSSTRAIAQANSFTPPCIVRRSGANFTLASASSASTADIWLCVAANATSFRIANECTVYPFPNHGLGADDEILKLSATVDGRLTTVTPASGNYLVILGRIVDKDNILWAPSFRVEQI